MAFIEIKAEPGLVKELIGVLKRIADGIDRAYPPGPDAEQRRKLKPAGPESLVVFNPEAEWQIEQEEEENPETLKRRW